MTKDKEKHTCPHCGDELKRYRTPAHTTWGGAIQLICFNDECSYYVEGWEYMRETQQVKSSYRFRLDPATGATGPMPVWSKHALKDDIVEDDAEA